MALDTYDSYLRLAQDRPVKALRYARSIRDTLARPTTHPTEAARLDDALRGIRDGLRHAGFCGECGRALSDPDSIARGRGAICAHKLEGRAS